MPWKLIPIDANITTPRRPRGPDPPPHPMAGLANEIAQLARDPAPPPPPPEEEDIEPYIQRRKGRQDPPYVPPRKRRNVAGATL